MPIDRLVFPRPTEQFLSVTREETTETCPRCGSDDVRRYPLADHIGPRIATKCQSCFHALSIERPKPEDNWPPFRPAAEDWPSSRAG
jgi:hypothetical protein